MNKIMDKYKNPHSTVRNRKIKKKINQELSKNQMSSFKRFRSQGVIHHTAIFFKMTERVTGIAYNSS